MRVHRSNRSARLERTLARRLAILLLGFGACTVAAQDCAPNLAPVRPRLAAAIDTLLRVPSDRDSASRLARLDADVVAWADRELDALSEGRRENVLEILEQPAVCDALGRGSRRLDVGVGAQVLGIGEKLTLVMDVAEAETEIARFLLVHELAHLVRFVTDGSRRACLKRGESLYGRRFGVYREELWAWRESHRFVRRNYAWSDLDRLVTRDDFDRAIARATRANVASLKAGHIVFDSNSLRNDDAWCIAHNLVTKRAEFRLRAQIYGALNEGESAYAKAQIRGRYRCLQRNRNRTWALRRFFGFTPPSADDDACP